MELFQVFWDDQRNLFLEFKKEQNEKFELAPDKVKSLNLKYEIVPFDKNESYSNEPPYLISIKKFNFIEDSIFLSINFDDLNYFENLEINFLLLTILFYTGIRREYLIGKKYEMAEISIVEDNIYEIFKLTKQTKLKIENSISQERIIETVDKDLESNHEKRTFVYEKKKIKNKIEADEIFSLINKGNLRLENVEEELKNIKSILKNLSFNNTSNVPYCIPEGPTTRMAIERIKRTGPPKPIQAIKPTGTLAYLPELKALMKDKSKFEKYLKQMSDEELAKLTLNDDLLFKKQEELYEKQIERLESKKNSEITLENLKKPK